MLNINILEVKNKVNDGFKLKELADYFNCSISTIYILCKKNNIKLKRGCPKGTINSRNIGIKITKEIFLEEYFKNEKTCKDIAKQFSSSKTAICRLVKKYDINLDKNKGKLSGKNHPSWKGGVTKLQNSIRKMFEYFEWRQKVYSKDNFTCQNCFKRGGNINADHIKPFIIILEENNIKSKKDARKCKQLWDINNGRVLCVECHKKTDTYGEKVKELLKNVRS